MYISKLEWDDYRIEHIARHDVDPDEVEEVAQMTQIQVPEFPTYEEEATFWDNLDTADFMDDDGEWFHFDTPHQRAVRIPILPNIVDLLQKRAHVQGVSVETLVNVLLLESIQETTIPA